MAIIIDFKTGRILSREEVAAMAGKRAVEAVTAAKPSAPPKPFTPPSRKRGTQPEEHRKSMLGKVHIAKKQLGLTEEEYRDMLSVNFNVDSAKFLNASQLNEFLRLMAQVGFKAKKGSAKRGANREKAVPALLDTPELNADTEPLMGKIEALLAEKGRAEGTLVPWNYAIGILKKQSGGVTKCFEHATPEQMRAVIAALTYDAKGKGRMVR